MIDISMKLSLEWVLSSIGFMIAFAIGLWQYRRAQRQERIGLILPLITEFETNEELRAGCRLFDYDAGTFTFKGKEYSWKNADLLQAMRVVEWDEHWSEDQEAMREILDRFFDFKGKLSSFIEVGLLDFKELNYFYYYFELLTGIEKYKGAEFETALDRYLTAYRFFGCRKCCDLYRNLPRSQRAELELSAFQEAVHEKNLEPKAKPSTKPLPPANDCTPMAVEELPDRSLARLEDDEDEREIGRTELGA